MMCPSFYNENSRLYYILIFVEKNSNLEKIVVTYKEEIGVHFPLVYNYVRTVFYKHEPQMTEIRDAKTNKLIFIKDNLNSELYKKLGNDVNQLTQFDE